MSQVTSKPLRVLYVDYSVGFGGAIKSLALTLSRLDGVEATIVTAQDGDIVRTWLSGRPVHTFRRFFNYRTAERLEKWIESRRTARFFRTLLLKGYATGDALTTVWNTIRLTLLLRRGRFDVIHLNNGFVPGEAIAAAGFGGVPCIVHLRGFQEDRSSLTLRRMDRVTRVIAVSGAVKEDLQRGTRLRPDQITVVHDPVDLDLMYQAEGHRSPIRERHGLEPHHIAIGIFGRVIPWKGQMMFVKAVIRAMQVNPDIRGVIVGDESDGGRDYFDQIRRTIEAAGATERFVFTGYAADVERYYAAMDVVVHASIEPEPFGMVVPEGMAAGRPVIAADEGGPREVVTHGHDGLLVPPRDEDALMAAMVRLAGDPEERRRLATNAAQTARRRFGIPTNARSVRAVYDAVFSGTVPASSEGSKVESLQSVGTEV